MNKLTHMMISAGLLVLPLSAFAQQYFSTPDQAAQSLIKAVDSHDEGALQQLLGDDWQVYLPEKDVDQDSVARFLRDWKVSHTVVLQGNTAHLNVGAENWQLPIPMVKTTDGWSFDMQKGAAEIEVRTIGRNELSAIEAVTAYTDAQQQYWQTASGTPHYAQKFLSSEGQHDGLYWPVKEGETPSPLGPAFGNDQPGSDYHGYYYRILTQQGKNAEGGALNYVDNGQMVKGFALIAWPVSYGHTGITSFMINQKGVVYQKDMGDDTDAMARKIDSFDPDASWQPIDEEP